MQVFSAIRKEKKMKRIYKRLFAMVLTIAIAIPIFVVPISAVQTPITTSTSWTKEDCIEIKDYINENFATFVDEYNTAFPEDKFAATGIEYWALIHLVEDDNVGLYLDFDGNNGYFVGTGDYKIYELQTAGDLPELKEETDIYFSYADGFLYLDERGKMQKYSILFEDDEYDLQRKLNNSNTAMSRSGISDGGIPDITSHVSQNYSGYTYVEHNTYLSTHLIPTRQGATAYYSAFGANSNGEILTNGLTEGNCALHAMYQTMALWSNLSFINIPHSNTVDLSEVILTDPLYNDFGTGALRVNNGNLFPEHSHIIWRTRWGALDSIPVLYHRLRSYAISDEGSNAYRPDTGYGNYDNAMEYVANVDYGQNIQVNRTTNVSDVIDSIDNYKAVVLSVNNSVVYNNHGMCLVGYYKYSYKKTVLFFEVTEYAYFYMVADGHTASNKEPEDQIPFEARYVYYDPYSQGTEYYFILD